MEDGPLIKGECIIDNANIEPSIIMKVITRHNTEVNDIKEEMNYLRPQFQEEVDYLIKRLREVEYQRRNIDDQLNDLRELHQNQIQHINSSVRQLEKHDNFQREKRAKQIRELL